MPTVNSPVRIGWWQLGRGRTQPVSRHTRVARYPLGRSERGAPRGTSLRRVSLHGRTRSSIEQPASTPGAIAVLPIILDPVVVGCRPNLLWTCEAVSFAANEGNQYDCRRPQVPNTTHLTSADARRNDVCLDAPGWMAATNGQPMPRTWAEKEQRKALWMKAVWRSHAGCSEAVRCERLRPTASRRRHLRAQDARSAGS